MNSKDKKYDLIFILFWPLIATILAFLLKFNALASILIFLILPSIYLSFRGGKIMIYKAMIFTLLSGLTTIIIIDYTAQKSGSWLMYPISIIPYKLFGLVTFEVIIWALFTCYFVVIFYEYFLDEKISRKLWNPHMKYLIMIILITFSLFILVLSKFPSVINIPYYYMIWGTSILLIPFLIHLFKYPKTSLKFFMAAAYFFYLNSLYEISALKLGWWTFPGDKFIGWVTILNVRFPLEEVIFWFILLALTTLSYFEFFEDNEKN